MPILYNSSAVSAPMPSMFMAWRPTKCSMRPTICGGQAHLLGHTHAASPSTRTSGVPHSGQWVTKTTGALSAGRCDMSTPVILGMISPPFSTYTMSPLCISRLRITSALCSEARLTMVPDSSTGSRLATGVIVPIRPTSKDTKFIRVRARSAWNL